MKIKKSKSVLSIYESSINERKTFFGLPQTVEFCSSCVTTNQKPNSTVEFSHTKDSKKDTIHFDKNGVYDACNLARQKGRFHNNNLINSSYNKKTILNSVDKVIKNFFKKKIRSFLKLNFKILKLFKL